MRSKKRFRCLNNNLGGLATAPLFHGEHVMTNLYFNNEPMVWVTVDENSLGEWVVSFCDYADYLLPLSQAQQCVDNNIIPEEYWG